MALVEKHLSAIQTKIREAQGTVAKARQSVAEIHTGHAGDLARLTALIDIGRLLPAFPVTPPDMRVRIRRFGGLSYRPTVNLGIPSESK